MMVYVHGAYAEFRFFKPQAKQVFLAGDFNRWGQQQLAMQRDSGGYWKAALRLLPGSYAFKYLADGEWFIDYASFGIENGPHGPNAVVRIPAQPVECPHGEICRKQKQI